MARRAWARNANAIATTDQFNRKHPDDYRITMPYLMDNELMKNSGL
ncbi:MAG: hypothetical protein GX921_10185 [Bacteroidales bacterium]|nr:hypothetical protein [Bacteroidales bacterium]